MIWRWPLLIGAASCFGLVAALVADGVLDAVASASLAIPVVLVCWFFCASVEPFSIHAGVA